MSDDIIRLKHELREQAQMRGRFSTYQSALDLIESLEKRVAELEAEREVVVNENLSHQLIQHSAVKPKGKWYFERSSGYAGYRCRECMSWVYNDAPRVCLCDATDTNILAPLFKVNT